MFNSKFKCGEKVWFMNDNKPIERFIYQITKVDDLIFYIFTSVAGYFSTEYLYAHESKVFKNKKELLVKLRHE